MVDEVGRIPVTLKHPSCGGTTMSMQASKTGLYCKFVYEKHPIRMCEFPLDRGF